MVKKRIVKPLLLSICIISAIGLLFTGCTVDETDDVPVKVSDEQSASSTTSKSASKAEDAKPKVETFKIGDTVSVHDYNIRVNSIRTDNGDSEGIVTPNSGNEFLYVDCTVENKSAETQTVSSVMMFKVQDADGRSYDWDIGTNKGQLDGDVASGRKITGEIAVQVPKGKTGLQLVFDADITGDQQVYVQLN